MAKLHAEKQPPSPSVAGVVLYRLKEAEDVLSLSRTMI